MRFFTADYLRALQIDDTGDEAGDSGSAWDAYQAHLRSLRPTMPAEVARLADEMLVGGEVRHGVIDEDGESWYRLEATTDGRWVIDHLLAGEPVRAEPPGGRPRSFCPDTIAAREIDRGDAPGVFVHRVLFCSGAELSIPFTIADVVVGRNHGADAADRRRLDAHAETAKKYARRDNGRAARLATLAVSAFGGVVWSLSVWAQARAAESSAIGGFCAAGGFGAAAAIAVMVGLCLLRRGRRLNPSGVYVGLAVLLASATAGAVVCSADVAPPLLGYESRLLALPGLMAGLAVGLALAIPVQIVSHWRPNDEDEPMLLTVCGFVSLLGWASALLHVHVGWAAGLLPALMLTLGVVALADDPGRHDAR